MSADLTSTLESEIAAARLEISADTISMSITELTSLYKEGTLVIRPEFQRLFRWSREQKSRLVESVLLGIPLPSLFVAQSELGTWELVDGLQRVSTLLELQGVLVGASGALVPELILDETKFLPRLARHTWSGGSGNEPLSEAQKLDIRLARLDIKVIKRSSDPKAKFDLFQRLNSFGSALTGQEIRSAMIAGTNSDALAWLTKLARNEDFVTCAALSDRLIEEQYDLELVLRFLMLHNRKITGRSGLTDFSARLNDWSVDFATAFPQNAPALREVFEVTFGSLAQHGGEDIFKKWDPVRSAFRGGFSNTSFEVFALGLAYCIANGKAHNEEYLDLARKFWSSPEMVNRFATGLATADRFVKTIPLGRELLEVT